MTEGLSISFWNGPLAEIDAAISSAAPGDVPRLLEALPLDIFALLLLERPAAFRNLREYLPPLPSGEIQESWNGAQGRELLRMSVDFVKAIGAKYSAMSPKPLPQTDVLDFGCGWGRLMRLMLRYVPEDQLYGVDPWDESLQLCRSCGVRGHLALSDYVPRALPFERRFDLIYAFSVLTHLSRKTTLQVLSTLRRYISDEGWLLVTIRPEEYWHYHDGGKDADERIAAHRRDGFSFVPHDRVPIDGDVTYGDTTFTLDWLADAAQGNWVIHSTDYCMGDLLQVIVALRPC